MGSGCHVPPTSLSRARVSASRAPLPLGPGAHWPLTAVGKRQRSGSLAQPSGPGPQGPQGSHDPALLQDSGSLLGAPGSLPVPWAAGPFPTHICPSAARVFHPLLQAPSPSHLPRPPPPGGRTGPCRRECPWAERLWGLPSSSGPSIQTTLAWALVPCGQPASSPGLHVPTPALSVLGSATQ